jgi:prepilin-type processing-associated H-X9-DG protein
MGLVFKMYSNESSGETYPPMANRVAYEVRDLEPFNPASPPDYSNYQESVAGECFYANPFEQTVATGGQGKVQFTFGGPALYPEYLTDPHILICPSDSNLDEATNREDGRWYNQNLLQTTGERRWDPCAFTPESYVYMGWALNGAPGKDYLSASADPNDPGVANVLNPVGPYLNPAFIVALQQRVTEVAFNINSYDGDIDLGTGMLFRTREGIERFFITDINNPAGSVEAQSSIPVTFDLVSTVASNFNHVPGGANVLYMDGHVTFTKYPGEFPVTRVFARMTSLF